VASILKKGGKKMRKIESDDVSECRVMTEGSIFRSAADPITLPLRIRPTSDPANLGLHAMVQNRLEKHQCSLMCCLLHMVYKGNRDNAISLLHSDLDALC
jgi:hypothetical protein